MTTVANILDALGRIAPAETALGFDKVGLQIGEAGDEVRTGVVSLDSSPGLVEFALEKRAQIAVCHHPLVWDPLAAVNSSTRSGRLAVQLIRHGIAFVGCHTNWDAAPGGINDTLASILGLHEVRPIGESAKCSFLKLVVFCPKGAQEAVIDALAEVGAGVIGLYERCAFYGGGTGTYRGLEGSNPAIGQSGRIEHAEELRVEMRLPMKAVPQAVEALRRVHPYEEAAYDLYPLVPEDAAPIGRIGLIGRMGLIDFQKLVDVRLSTRSWAWGGPEKRIERVAVCGGAADGEWRSALASGADAFLTGEVRHHVAIEASEAGLAVIAAGHYATEHPGCAALCERLEGEVPGVEWHLYEPKEGEAGRALGS